MIQIKQCADKIINNKNIENIENIKNIRSGDK
jgi:hypothetical protein